MLCVQCTHTMMCLGTDILCVLLVVFTLWDSGGSHLWQTPTPATLNTVSTFAADWTSLRGFHLFSKARVVLSRLRGCPLSISVLRWRAQDGTVYRPLIKLLRALRVENPTLQLGPAPSQQTATKDQTSSQSQCLKEGRQVITQLLKEHLSNVLLNLLLTLRHRLASCQQDCVYSAVLGKNKHWNGNSALLRYNLIMFNLCVYMLISHNWCDIWAYSVLAWGQGGAAAGHPTSIAEKPAKQGNKTTTHSQGMLTSKH